MPNLLDVEITSTGQSILLYGPPFCGKTELASQLVYRFDKVYWFDLEKGFVTLKKLPPEQQKKITLYRIPDTKDNPVAIDTMTKVFAGLPVSICDAHGKVGCAVCKTKGGSHTSFDASNLDANSVVVMDSLTQLSDSAEAEATKSLALTDKLEYDHHRIQGALLKKPLGCIQQANYNIVVTSHEINISADDKKEKLVPAGGTRNFSRRVGKYFDHVVHMTVSNKEHKAFSSSVAENKVLTGSRTDVAIENDPEMQLVNVLHGVKIEPQKPGSKKPVQAKKVNSKLAQLQARTK